MDTQICIKCGGTWPLSFFHIHRKGRKRANCIGCARRTKRRNPLYFKAKNSRTRHAKNFGLNAAQFDLKFGWKIERMVEDLQITLDSRCPYCLDPIAEAATLTFDVIDPKKPPNYSSNVRVCCLDCNSAKHDLAPEAWAERLKTWIEYREWMTRIRDNPLIQLPLFSK